MNNDLYHIKVSATYMNYLNNITKCRIEEKLKQLNKSRPLPPSLIKKLEAQFRIDMTYNSNGIEGNSLTMKETFLVINEGITIKGKPLKDHLEAKDHYAALEFLSDMVDKNKSHTISEHLIRYLHELVVLETDRKWAGKYRNSNVIIGGADHKPPEAIEIPSLIHDTIIWARKYQKTLHPIEFAAIFHHKIVYIHPFFDGNGRTARLLMNLLLMQKKFPLTIILKNDRKKYYHVLSLADKGNYVPLVNFVSQSVERSLNIYIKTITPSSVKKPREMSLSEASKNSNFSSKYLNLLAREGKLEAYKEGRNWITTKEAIEQYLKNRERKRK